MKSVLPGALWLDLGPAIASNGNSVIGNMLDAVTVLGLMMSIGLVSMECTNAKTSRTGRCTDKWDWASRCLSRSC